MSGASTLFLGARLRRQRPRTFGASSCISIGRFRRGDDQQHGFGATLFVSGDGEARYSASAGDDTQSTKATDMLSLQEAAGCSSGTPGIKYDAALGVVYGAGLRVCEVAHLKVDDIESTRMLIRVEQGKGCTFVSSVHSSEFKPNGSSN